MVLTVHDSSCSVPVASGTTEALVRTVMGAPPSCACRSSSTSVRAQLGRRQIVAGFGMVGLSARDPAL
jgi:hypothetical protein